MMNRFKVEMDGDQEKKKKCGVYEYEEINKSLNNPWELFIPPNFSD